VSEGFEQFVKVALEAEDLIVSGNLKFFVRRRTKNRQLQTHGYDVDLVGARRDKLVLASVKSFFGSKGVGEQGFDGIDDPLKSSKEQELYKMFNYPDVQEGIIKEASRQFGYTEDLIELRLYVGRFKNARAQKIITEHLLNPPEGLRPAKVFGIEEIAELVLAVLNKRHISMTQWYRH